MLVPQRGLTNLKVHLADATLDAKYAFPFWASDWRVRFVLLDLMGAPAAVIPVPVTLASMNTITVPSSRSAARLLTSYAPTDFAGLNHLDPVWILRGGVGLSESQRHAILRTNLAGKTKHGSEKVHDIEFGERFEEVLWVVTKDRTFVTRRYTRGQLNVADLR